MIKRFLIIALLSSTAWAGTYVTDFGATENPLSEGGKWVNSGGNWKNCQSTPGIAFGSQTGAVPPPYDDSTCIMSGTWGAFQSVQVTVRQTQTDPSATSEEVEIRLRTTLTSTVNSGYEINCSVTGAQYMEVVRWNGALNDFTVLHHVDGVGCANGTVFRATMTGNTLTVFNNGTQVTGLNTTDSTFATGSPGMGFFLRGTGTNSHFGFSRFIATDGQILNAANCNSSSVGTSLGQITADNAVVVVPAGTCTWSSQLVYNQTFSTTILGQTTCSGTPASSCVDNTTLTNTFGQDVFKITTASGKAFRISGLTFSTGSLATGNGVLNVGGQSNAVRIDHIHFNHPNPPIQTTNTELQTFNVMGVIDHIVTHSGNNSEFWRPQMPSYLGVGLAGDNSWNQPSGLGTASFMFLEDSTINGTGQQGSSAIDCYSGGRYVARYTVFNDSSTQGHTTGHAGDDRGCRAQEMYHNTFPAPPGGIIAFNAFDWEGGPTMIWGNSVTNYSNFATVHDKRVTLGNQCGGTGTYCQGTPPAGWGYCGNSATGVTSAWDQDTTTNGYACIDMPGRGQGDLLQGTFPSKCNLTLNPACNTFTGQWPRQKLEPGYEWQNTWSCPSCGGNFWAVFEGVIQANRDYFLAQGNASCNPGAASCTAGTGVGTLAQRPTNCSANGTEYPTGNRPGVGYWATDQQTLYVCTATNTWTSYYQPYTYPHPLQGGGSQPPPPLTITTGTNLPPAGSTQAYSTTLTATGGTSPYLWSITTGTLPEGLNLNTGTGVISGTVPFNDSQSFAVTVTDSASSQATQSFTLSVSCGGVAPYPCARTDSAILPLPATPNMGNLTGSGTIITEPNFSGRIVRVTDANVNNANFLASNGGGDFDILWNRDDTRLVVTRNGGVHYVYQFNPTTMVPTLLYGGFSYPGDTNFSSGINNRLYVLNNLTVGYYDVTATTGTPTLTTVVNLGTCLPPGYTQTWNSFSGVGTDDAIVVAGFSSVGAQNTGFDVVAWHPTKGCMYLNTSTGAITADLGWAGGSGLTCTTSCTGTMTTTDRFAIHNTTSNRDGYTIELGFGACISPGPGLCQGNTTGQAYYWIVGTTTVENLCVSNCGGHSTIGNHRWINRPGSPAGTWYIRNVGTGAGTQLNTAPGNYSTQSPQSMHLAWRNGNDTDTAPVIVTHMYYHDTGTCCIAPTNPPAGPWWNEMLGIQTNAAAGAATVWRFGRMWNTGDSTFFTAQQGIGVVSQTGRFMAFTSDWLGTLGSTAGASTCTVSTNCRADVFVRELLPTTLALSGTLSQQCHFSPVATAIAAGLKKGQIKVCKP